LLELMTQLEIALELSYLDQESFAKLEALANEVLRMMNGLIDSLRKKAKAATGGAS
jgi:four helix bundle protein